MTTENEQGYRERMCADRERAFSLHFGKSADVDYHAPIPFYLGGNADVVVFPSYRGGIAYITFDLTGGDVGQIPGPFGGYELMVCTRSQNERAVEIISRLARYTCDAKLKAGETMDIRDSFGDQSIRAFLFCHPEERPIRFEVCGQPSSVLLCVGITSDELEFKMKKGSEPLLALLKEKEVFPFTEPDRASVLPKRRFGLW